MRERLIAAFEQAAQPVTAHVRRLNCAPHLALPVLARDHALGWRLREQPDRLAIDTFDAFCARIVARSYVSRVSGGALGRVTDAAETLSGGRHARNRCCEIADAVRGVFAVSGNQVDSVIELLAGLLARARNGWVRRLIPRPDAIRRTHRCLTWGCR